MLSAGEHLLPGGEDGQAPEEDPDLMENIDYDSTQGDFSDNNR